METDYKSEIIATLRIMSLGAFFAFLFTLPHYNNIYETLPLWTSALPLKIMYKMIFAMQVFFHEIGHTIFMIFYGYFAIPIFDPYWGGGWSVPLSNQMHIILVLIYAGFAYYLYQTRDYPLYRNIIICLAVFQISTAFITFHEILILFMGHGTEAVIAAFFLYRAWFNLAPRGNVERFLNALFGFAFIFNSIVEGYGLLNYEPLREVYYHQKGGVGAGDFDRIESIQTIFDFNDITRFWIFCNIIALIAPIIIYVRHTHSRYIEEKYFSDTVL